MVVPFRLSGVVCRFSLQTWRIFLCQNPSLWPDCIFLLHVLEFPILFHFVASSLISSMYFRWLIFSCDLLGLFQAEPFLSMWLSVIIAIINSNSDSVSPWNIPVWIFALAYYYCHHYYLILYVFFTLVLDGGFSLESEWQHVFSCLQDSS